MRHDSCLRSPLSLRSVSLGVDDAKRGPANRETAPIVALQTRGQYSTPKGTRVTELCKPRSELLWCYSCRWAVYGPFLNPLMFFAREPLTFFQRVPGIGMAVGVVIGAVALLANWPDEAENS